MEVGATKIKQSAKWSTVKYLTCSSVKVPQVSNCFKCQSAQVPLMPNLLPSDQVPQVPFSAQVSKYLIDVIAQMSIKCLSSA